MFIDEILNHPRNKDKPAIIDESGQLTYGELLERSSIVAATFIKSGLQGNVCVAIYMEKSIEQIISIFGILKSGASYVPIDYDLPIERVEYIFSNCKPAFVVTDYKGMEKLQSTIFNRDYSYLIMDDCSEEALCYFENNDPTVLLWKNLCQENIDFNYLNSLERSEKDIAYILFTSGSTGKPKGVMIRHESVEAFTRVAIEFMGYSEQMRMLSISPLYFDVSVPDIFCTLRAGGTLFLMKKFLVPNDILEALQKYEITDVIMVASILKLLSSRYSKLQDHAYTTLKTIWYGGESCPVYILELIQRAFINCEIVHGYGQTETTFCALVYKLDASMANHSGALPVGKPLPTIQAYAFNDHYELIKPHEIGEIYIGGIQVMKGYCNNEIKTNEVIVRNIFHSDERMYKTGDYVTLDNAGNYIFLGRRDDMIKSRGKIVYLSEVERVILSCPGVKDVIVLPHVDDLELTTIKAFIIPTTDKHPAIKELIKHIEMKLPKYMVPQYIKVVYEEELPKSSTGKIDRKKLMSLPW